ncbi:MAG: hypothetical protein R3296_03100 [Oleiphilaceae bacterium]|nr:hypothetical protein [Oleiphilaceae bacterium]
MTFEESVLARGEARGEAKGEAKKSQQIALNLLKEGADEDYVSRVTRLSPEQIKQWQASTS